MKTTLQNAQRKTQGNLLVRDLNSIVKPEHVVDSETLETLVRSQTALPERAVLFPTCVWLTEYVGCRRWWWCPSTTMLTG